MEQQADHQCAGPLGQMVGQVHGSKITTKTGGCFFFCDPRHNKNRRVVLHSGDFWHKMPRAESKQKMLRKYAAQMSSLTISGYLGFGLELLRLLRRHRLLAMI